MLRIISGKYKGRRLRILKGLDIRPSSDRVKETVFNILSSRIDFEGLDVLDLYAGTGNYGLEAISRGARKAVFVEISSKAVRNIKENIELLGCSEACEIIRDDSLAFIEYSNEKFDLIFADPPYAYKKMDELVNLISEKDILNDDGFFVLEHPSKLEFSNEFKNLEIETTRNFGRTKVTIFKHIPNTS